MILTDPDDFNEILAKLANENSAAMDGTPRPVLDVLADNDIVFAIWQDPDRPGGVGRRIIKGDRIVQEIIADKSLEFRFSAIACSCEEQAIALKEVHGEKDERH